MSSFNIANQAEQTIDVLVKLAHCVEPVEHVSGRIEMRVPLMKLASVMALLDGIDLERGVESIPGLKEYSIDLWMRSATIDYDPNVLSFELWNDLCAIKENPSAERIIRDKLLSVLRAHSNHVF
ncbi:MAG TPA: hypothetical protein VK463_20725 [Desulfomonilaceae bacterium]|nr:hypothetical protein [Desulfomonilaceae bacterium]